MRHYWLLKSLEQLTVVGIVRKLRDAHFDKAAVQKLLAECENPVLSNKLTYAIDLL